MSVADSKAAEILNEILVGSHSTTLTALRIRTIFKMRRILAIRRTLALLFTLLELLSAVHDCKHQAK